MPNINVKHFLGTVIVIVVALVAAQQLNEHITRKRAAKAAIAVAATPA